MNIHEQIAKACNLYGARYAQLKEEAIREAIKSAEGELPTDLATVAEHGLFTVHPDQREEFSWKGKPRFFIRIRFNLPEVWVEVRDL